MEKTLDKKVIKAIEKGNPADVKKALTAANMNAQDKKGETVLHTAARAGNLEICKLLVQSGCDPKIRNAKGQTASDIVDIKKKKAVATWLKEQEINASPWGTILNSSVNIYYYENEAWKSMVSGGAIEVLHNPSLFAYKLIGKDSAHFVCFCFCFSLK
jgi:ankyrin repeat protein